MDLLNALLVNAAEDSLDSFYPLVGENRVFA
jgi:hypothetical protein